MRKITTAIILSLSASFTHAETESFAPSVPDVKGAYDYAQKVVDTRMLLLVTSFAIQNFEHNIGCIPASPQDLINTPDEKRLRKLSCHKNVTEAKWNFFDLATEHYSINQDNASHMRSEFLKLKFVQNHNEPWKIEWQEPLLGGKTKTMQCSFLEANYGNCPSIPHAK